MDVFRKVLVYLFEQNFAKSVALWEMAEFKDRGFVRQPLQFQAGELADGFDLVQGIFHRQVA